MLRDQAAQAEAVLSDLRRRMEELEKDEQEGG